VVEEESYSINDLKRRSFLCDQGICQQHAHLKSTN